MVNDFKNENLQDPLIPLSRAASTTPYSAEYLSLRARRGKLKATKINDIWHVRVSDLADYVRRYEKADKSPLLPLSQAAIGTPYSAEYLALRARTGKLKATKVNDIWHVRAVDLAEYVKKQEEHFEAKFENKKIPATNPFAVTLYRARKQRQPRELRAFSHLFVEFPELSLPIPSIFEVYKLPLATLSLMLAIVGGFLTLIQTESKLATRISTNAAAVLPISQVASLLDGYTFLRDIAFGIAHPSIATSTPTSKTGTLATNAPATSSSVGVGPASQAISQIGTTPVAAPTGSTLEERLQAYVRAQIANLAIPAPIVASNSSAPILNTTILRQEIITSDTKPVVRVQSSSDADTAATLIARLQHNGTFFNADLEGYTYTNATGTSATSTNLYAQNANFDNLFSTSVSFGNLLIGGATGTAATTTFLFAHQGAFDSATATNFFATNLLSSSSTFQNFIAQLSTTTSATTTNFFASQGTIASATSTNLFAANLLASGSSTLQNFTFQHATGTSATTTDFYSATGTFNNLYVNNYQQNNGTFAINSTVATGNIFGVTDTAITSGTLIHQTLTANAGNGQTSRGQIIDLTDNTSAGGGYSGLEINTSGSGTGSGSKTLLSLSPGGSNGVVFDSAGALRPTTNVSTNTNSLGSPSFYWKSAYVDTVNANSLSGTVITGATSNNTWTVGSTEAADSMKALIFQRNSGSGNATLSWDNGANDLRYLSVNYPFNATYTVDDSSISTAANLFSGALTNNTTSGTQKLLSLTNSGTGSTEDGIYLNNTGTGQTAIEVVGTWTNGLLVGSGSTTLQNFTFQNATGTVATTTNFYTTNFLANGSSTLQKFTATYASTTEVQSTSDSYFATSGGRVGVGTVSPAGIFEAKSTSASVAGGITTSNGTSAWHITSSGGSNDSFLAYNSKLNIGVSSGVGQAISSKLTIDSSGNLGIGTTTPQWKTQISATAAPQLTLSDSGLATSNHFSFRNSNGMLYIATSSPTNFATSTNPLYIVDGTTGNHVIPQGFLGVGTSSPSAKLAVSGSAFFDGGTITAANLVATSSIITAAATTTRINIWNAAADSFLKFTASTTGGLSQEWSEGVDTTSGKFHISSSTAVGTNDRLVIDGAGNVGVGTTNPGSILEVQSSVVSTNTGITMKNTSSSADAGASLFLDATAQSTNAKWRIGTGLPTSGGTATNLTFYNVLQGVTGMVIQELGNVGIGTTTPQWKTQISATAAPQLTLSDSGLATSNHFSFRNSNGMLYIATSSPTNFATSTNPLYIVDGTTGNHVIPQGFLGVGTSSPSAKLAVSGSAFFDGGTITAANLVATSTLITPYASTTVLQSTSDAYFATSGGKVGIGTTTPPALLSINDPAGTNPFLIGSSTAKFIVKASGNVGIGTNAPTTALDIEAPQGGILLKSLTGTNASYINFNNTGGNGYVGLNNSNGVGLLNNGDPYGLAIVGASGDNPIQFATGNTSSIRMSIYGTSGNVSIANNLGIGTTTPQFKLNIVGSGSQLTLSDGTAGSKPFSFRQVGSTLYIATSSQTSFATSTAPLFMLDGTTGYTAIGTTTPSAILTLSATSSATTIAGNILLNIDNTNSGNAGVGSGIAFRRASTTGLMFTQAAIDTTDVSQTATSGILRFSTNNSGTLGEVMRLTNTGNVGIGTTTPSSLLNLYSSTDNSNPTLTLSGGTGSGGNVGQISFYSNAGSAEVGRIQATRDSGNTLGHLGLFTNNVSNGLTERLTVLSSGNVGVGTSTPQAKFAIDLAMNVTNDGMRINDSSSQGGSTYERFTVGGGGVTIGSITSNLADNQIAYNQTSDVRLKENIVDSHYGLDDLMKIQVKDFSFISDPRHTIMNGFLAQQLDTVYPDAVTPGGDNPTTNPWQVDYGRITPLLVKAIQGLASITGAFRDNLIAWLGNAGNGIHDLFAAKVHTKELCVADDTGETCITRSQLNSLLASAGQSYTVSGPSTGTNFTDTSSSTIEIIPPTNASSTSSSDITASSTPTSLDSSAGQADATASSTTP